MMRVGGSLHTLTIVGCFGDVMTYAMCREGVAVGEPYILISSVKLGTDTHTHDKYIVMPVKTANRFESIICGIE